MSRRTLFTSRKHNHHLGQRRHNASGRRLAFDVLEDRRLLAGDVTGKGVDAGTTAPLNSGETPSVNSDLAWTSASASGAAASASDAEFSRPEAEFFNPGDANQSSFYAPALTRTPGGAIIAIAEARSSVQNDASVQALVGRRSIDNGATWSPVYTLYDAPGINAGVVVADEITGDLFYVMSLYTSQLAVIHSTDDGITWSSAINITATVKVTGPNSPAGHAYTGQPWGWLVPGPGHGIQLKHGPNAGRLLVAADHRYAGGDNTVWSHVIYSDDHGSTWKLGGGLNETTLQSKNAGEAALVELNNGDVYLSARTYRGPFQPYRGYARSSDGGLTWSELQVDPILTTPSVQGSLLRVNENLVLFAAPNDTADRKQITVWASYDDTQTWVKKKVIFFGDAGYSDMALAGPDTIILAYNRGHRGGRSGYADSIGLARFTVGWLESTYPYQFNWYFNERMPGEPANILGASIQDYSVWDNRARARSNDAPPMYVAAANGETGLSLTTGSDDVLLTPTVMQALQFSADESFTLELVIRTTSDSGVLIGTKPSWRNWTLAIVNGRLELSLFDLAENPKITSSAPINDGNWHHIAAVRDAVGRQLRIYVDRVPAAAPVLDTTTTTLRSLDEVILGAFNDGTQQLAFDVDTVRVTRGVVSPADFLPIDFVSPLPLPPPAIPPDAPTSIPGLQLWIPRFDPTRNFGDLEFASPMRLQPIVDDAVHSAIDMSGHQWRAVSTAHVLYAYDSVMGPYWSMDSQSSGASASWQILNSNGTQASNFDFVQNTGVFTFSAFIKPSSDIVGNAGYSALFDTDDASRNNPGFLWILNADGTVGLQLTSGNGTYRYHVLSLPGVATEFNRWYHLAVVGSGPGQPVAFYVTPIDASTVASYSSSDTIQGPNGNFATDAEHNLQIGASAKSALRGLFAGMVDAAAFDRALTPAEIQQLFENEKRTVSPLLHPLHPPIVSNATTFEDSQSTAGIVITRSLEDGPEVSHFKITSITGGALFQHDGVTPIAPGSFITATQGNAGLRFTPLLDSIQDGSFGIQSAIGADGAELSAVGVLAKISVVPVNDPPSFVKGPDQFIAELAGDQTIFNWAKGMSAGPADESNQAMSFVVTNDNPILFLAQPAISPDGTLTFSVRSDVPGIATVTVILRDNGGLSDGGQSDSPPQTFVIAHYILHPPIVSNTATLEDVPLTNLVISRNPLDGPEVTHFKITGITGGSLYQNGGLVPIQNGEFISAAQASAGLTFVPSPNSVQSGLFDVQSTTGATEGGVSQELLQAQIVITPVNDPPSFTTGGDIEIHETSSPQILSGWATAIAPGPPDEAGQTLTIQVTNDNPALFSVQPTISLNGTLSFNCAPDQNGSATVSVVFKDNGGTAHGGSDTSLRTFHITIDAVNDPPTFVKGGDQFTESFAGNQIVSGWASNVSPGPSDESNQQVDFVISNNNPGLFSQQPSIAADGTLSYTPASGASGNALVTVALHDDGGVALGGSNTSAPQTFKINIGPIYHVLGDSFPNQNDVIRIVRRQAFFDVYVNNNSVTPTASQAIAAWTAISVNALGGNDSLIIDYSGGNPIPVGGLAYDGGSGTDSLTILGISGQDGLFFPSVNVSNEGYFAVDGLQQALTGVESLTTIGFSTLTVLSAVEDGSLAIDSPFADRNRLTSPVFATLTFLGTGTLILDTASRPATAAGGNVTISSAGLVGATSLQFNSGDGHDSLTTNGGAVDVDLNPSGQLDLTVNSGTVSLGESVALHTLSITAGALLSIDGVGAEISSSGLTVSGDATIDVSSSNSANLGSIFTTLGTASQLTKIGDGSMFLGGAQYPGPGATLNANAGTTIFASDGGWNLSVHANAAVMFGATQHLTAVNIGPEAVVAIAGAGAVLVTASLTIDPTGKLDVGQGGLIVYSDSVNSAAVEAAIQNYLRSGFHAGDWHGHGITSSSLGISPHEIVSLGISRNFVYQSFMGQPVDTNSILVRYTYAGDADLSGLIDGTDFALIDNGYNFGQSTWHDGDVDFNGIIDGTDYAYIDNAYNLQPAPLSAVPAAAVAPLNSPHAIANPLAMPLASSSTAPVPVSIPTLDSPAQSQQSLEAPALARIFADEGSQTLMAESVVTQRRRTEIDIALLDDALFDLLAFAMHLPK